MERLTIKCKLTLLAILVGIGFVILIIYNYSATSTLMKFNNIARKTVKLEAEMLMLRRNEKDFIARKDLKYSVEFSQTFNKITLTLEKVEQLLLSVDISSQHIAELTQVLINYQDKFSTLVKQQQYIGLHAKDGLYNSLISKVHQIEHLLIEHRYTSGSSIVNLSLMQTMLMLRQDEKDFMLRLDITYVEKFNLRIDSMRNKLANSQMNNDFKRKTNKALNNYQQQFVQLVEAEQKLGLTSNQGIHGEMRDEIHQSESLLKSFSQFAIENVDKYLVKKELIDIMVCLFLTLLIMLILIIIAKDISKRITHLSKLMTLTTCSKNMSLRADISGDDEISAMAKVYNDMMTALEMSRHKSKKAEQLIKKLAFFDKTTQALNRYSFEKDLIDCLSETNNIDKPVIFLVNIDKFSQINLIYGEKEGDHLLKSIVTRIKNSIPSWGFVYRSSADVFFVILKKHTINTLSNDNTTSPRFVAENILQQLKQDFIIQNQTISITASIGILSCIETEIDIHDVKPLLELAVYNAKSQGGNALYFAQHKEMALLRRHSELTMAMKSNEFINELNLVLQPQYNTLGNIVGSEALIRWNSPYLGSVSPAEFIPLAESNGNILVIGEWMIEQVCYLLAQKRTFSKKHNPISINISPKQLAQPNFSKHLIETIDNYGIPHADITLELTESALIADLNLVIAKITDLKTIGIYFSLDDFGTGYSSLSYLQNLPIAELKIDKTFIDEITCLTKDVPIINAIIQMAKALNLKVVAEGVETNIQLEYLTHRGCDIFQGYLFSKPLDVNSWLNIIRTKNL